MGGVAHSTAHDSEGNVWFRTRISLPLEAKSSVARYLRAYNRYYKTSFSVSFPKNFRMKLTAASPPP